MLPDFKKSICLLLLCTCITCFLSAQDCQTTMVIKLENSKGGIFANQEITLSTKNRDQVYKKASDAQGEARFVVPCATLFDVSISNFTMKLELLSLDSKNSETYQTLGYSADMLQYEKFARMSDIEKAAVDKLAITLPDTVFIIGSAMASPPNRDMYAKFTIALEDYYYKPLDGEVLTLTGIKRNKTVVGTTDKNGLLVLYLLKGDMYRVNFRYDKNYSSTEARYLQGTSTVDLAFTYIGTKEIDRRKKAEAERLIAEAKRLKAEKDEFEKYCKDLGISLEEGYRRRSAEYFSGELLNDDTVISAVLQRNKWSEKLIVSDLSGSMMKYSAQLAIWYRLNHMKEKNLQFVFFNDGDNMPDELKKIGETGGIYFSKSSGIDSLNYFVSRVAAAGSGGDVAENNMEALIKGVKLAGPYKELVMIVDNGSPVKDIELLKDFNSPVHIIACGVTDEILADYLLIAWKTKGSIHTIEQDITAIASLMDGQTIIIGKQKYQLLNGRFLRIMRM